MYNLKELRINTCLFLIHCVSFSYRALISKVTCLLYVYTYIIYLELRWDDELGRGEVEGQVHEHEDDDGQDHGVVAHQRSNLNN